MNLLDIKYIARFTVVLSLGLIILGGFVRATGAGLACPDWPLCFGQVVPPLVYGVTQEFAHRVMAAVVSILTLTLTTVSFVNRSSHPRNWYLSLFLISLLVLQIVFGGLTVTMRLNPYVVTAHLGLGTLFFQSLSQLCYSERMSRPGSRQSKQEAINAHQQVLLQKIIFVLAGLIFIQILLGGFVASSGASLVCPDFPLCGDILTFEGGHASGSYLVQLRRAQEIQMAHRILGFSIFFVATLAWYVSRRNSHVVKRHLSFVLGMIVLQIIVGAYNVFFQIPVSVTLLHLLIAQGILFVVVDSWRQLSEIPTDCGGQIDEYSPMGRQKRTANA